MAVIANINARSNDQAAWLLIQNGDTWYNLYSSNRLELDKQVLIAKANDKQQVVVVPKHLEQQICHEYHDTPSYAHRCFTKTYDSIRSKFFWPHMYTIINQY